MNDQYFGPKYNPSDVVGGTYKDTTSPGVNSDVFADKVPVDATLIHETPMGGTVAAVGPLYESVGDETPLFETPLQEIPMGGTIAPAGPVNWSQYHNTPVNETPAEVIEMGGTVAAAGLMDETIVHETPRDEAIPYKTPVVESTADESCVSQPIPYQAPVGETITHEAPIVMSATPPAALLSHEESEHFRSRWNEIQGKFVDEPRSAVQEADALVSEVVEQITQMFAKEHSSLEGQWKQGEEVSTEDLRKALQHYRSFFNRLVV
jgi:hypothetical protein